MLLRAATPGAESFNEFIATQQNDADGLTDSTAQLWLVTLPGQPAIGADLIRRYDEPHRRYHTAEHLGHVLTMIDELADDRHDTFLVGRSNDSHFQHSYDDPYFSRRHFLVEVNPPRVRV